MVGEVAACATKSTGAILRVMPRWGKIKAPDSRKRAGVQALRKSEFQLEPEWYKKIAEWAGPGYQAAQYPERRTPEQFSIQEDVRKEKGDTGRIRRQDAKQAWYKPWDRRKVFLMPNASEAN